MPPSSSVHPSGFSRRLQSGDRPRPRVLFLADKRDWAFDINARAVAECLDDEFCIDIAYVREDPPLERANFDLLVVMFWGEASYRKLGLPPGRLVKQVSSHRWEHEPAYGPLSASAFCERYLSDAGTVIVPSQRLKAALTPFHENVFITEKGVWARKLPDPTLRSGPLCVGWAGNRNDSTKGLADILIPATEGRHDLLVAGGEKSPAEMVPFYQGLDVLLIASVAEGDPRPLIEGMALGCFPIATDVGIVPELVRHGENGLIVARTPHAFRAALDHCAQHLDQIRMHAAARANHIRGLRDWPLVAEGWRLALRQAVERAR